MFAKIENGIAVEYPVYEGQLQERFPNLSYPLDMSGDPIPEGYVRVKNKPFPNALDKNFQYRYELGMPVMENGEWVETYIEIPLTEEQKQNNILIVSHDIRKKRDRLLDISDKSVTIDRWEAMSDVEKLEWTDYRQELRDIPEQDGFPFDTVWPIEPSKFEIRIVNT